jgi:hypothetical protein
MSQLRCLISNKKLPKLIILDPVPSTGELLQKRLHDEFRAQGLSGILAYKMKSREKALEEMTVT